MADLPLFERPIFGFKKYNMGPHVLTYTWGQLERYHRFIIETLLPAQRTWVNMARDQGCSVAGAVLSEFESYPCMNDPAQGDVLEQIETRVLYVYLPEEAANSCLEQQSLEPIPDYMCSGDGERQVVAVGIPPNVLAASKRAIVAIYRQLGCDRVDTDDIKRCLVIPQTNLMTADGDVYRRCRIPYDIIADVPVMFT
ncbi:RolB family protein [Bradyrhizobium sp. Cp5.3]|uniref:RolB family protein n=1 Tax=Bradyrhizobium sp. Cp5.3 TaxID=443598 RepID=UPI000486C086|nr:RolB family protein [Bradyrhizobium sp. Cp5.3]